MDKKMNLGKNASYEDYARIDEARYPRTPEKIAEYWLEKYKESSDDGSSLLYEDDNIKLVAKNKPVYCSGWSEGDEDNPGTNDIVIETQVTIKDPNIHESDEAYPFYTDIEDGTYYIAVIFSQTYSYIETYHSNGSYWDPPESEGYYEPSGDIFIDDMHGPELFKTKEDAINAIKSLGKNEWLWDKPGVILPQNDTFFNYIGIPDNLENWCSDAPINDPDGVYDAYSRYQQDLEDRADEMYDRYNS